MLDHVLPPPFRIEIPGGGGECHRCAIDAGAASAGILQAGDKSKQAGEHDKYPLGHAKGAGLKLQAILHKVSNTH